MAEEQDLVNLAIQEAADLVVEEAEIQLRRIVDRTALCECPGQQVSQTIRKHRYKYYLGVDGFSAGLRRKQEAHSFSHSRWNILLKQAHDGCNSQFSSTANRLS